MRIPEYIFFFTLLFGSISAQYANDLSGNAYLQEREATIFSNCFGVKKSIQQDNCFDVPGNVRCAVRPGLQSESNSDSQDGFRICLGV